MASGPNTSWQIDGETMQIVRLYFLGLQNHCRRWLQPWNWHLLPGRKTMTNLDSILKSRDIILPIKVRLDKDMVFPIVMYGCEGWTIKKAEQWRTDAVALWCWRRLLRVSWTARSNQSTLKEISPEYSLEGLMLKQKPLATWCEGTDSLEKTMMLGRRQKGTTEDEMVGWHHQLNGWVWASSRSWWWIGKAGILQSMGLQSRTRLSNWTDCSVFRRLCSFTLY